MLACERKSSVGVTSTATTTYEKQPRVETRAALRKMRISRFHRRKSLTGKHLGIYHPMRTLASAVKAQFRVAEVVRLLATPRFRTQTRTLTSSATRKKWHLTEHYDEIGRPAAQAR
jgi:hypothetical protein